MLDCTYLCNARAYANILFKNHRYNNLRHGHVILAARIPAERDKMIPASAISADEHPPMGRGGIFPGLAHRSDPDDPSAVTPIGTAL
jgi:hypothetical protein